MRVAVVGVGRMGRLHAEELRAMPRVTELMVADADRDLARRVAAELAVEPAPSVEAALDRADALVIVAATDAHADLVRAGAERGLPVFVEKPLALELQETRELVELVERTGTSLQVGFQRRFDVAYVEAHRLVASGELGTLYLVKLSAHDMTPPPDHYIPTSGGIFRDSSIHDLDLVRWLTGVEVEEVYAAGSVRRHEVFARYDDVDTAAALLTLTDGTLAVLGQTRHDPLGYDIRTELIGSSDSVVVGQSPRTPLRSLEPGVPGPVDPWSTFLNRFRQAYRDELATFLVVAAGEVPSPCTARDGLEAMRIAVAANRSRREHRPIRLAEVEGG
jgi:myo-inositol 2-dehydrogenase / D-chiro-inositol 1-dehydrogenase